VRVSVHRLQRYLRDVETFQNLVGILPFQVPSSTIPAEASSFLLLSLQVLEGP
jgi:hypothetical protein